MYIKAASVYAVATTAVIKTPRFIAVLIALLLIPYLYLYAAQLWKNIAWLPLGDDYAFHVYFALVERGDPAALFTSPGEYPGVIHLIGFLTGDPVALGRIYAVYGALLIAAGVVLYALFFKALGASLPQALAASAAAVIGSVRTLAGIVDGQIADKTVLLVLVPTSLYLYARGRQTTALLVAGASLFTNFLGVAYAGALAVFQALFGTRKAKIALALLVAAGLVLTGHKFLTILTITSQFQESPGFNWSPLWGLIYGFYGPSPLLLIPLAAYYLPKARKARPLLATALVVVAASLISQAYGERLVRVASILVPAAVAASAIELGHRRVLLLALAAYLAGPAAAGWAWAAGHLPALFAPVERITPQKLAAYHAILSQLPPNASVEIMWSLDLWVLPLAKAYRPDLNITITLCNWTRAQYYIYTPPDPAQWYLPCIANAPPPPGAPLATYGETALYLAKHGG